MSEQPCKAKFDKYKDAYEDWEEAREDELDEFSDAMVGTGVAVATCFIPPFVQCVVTGGNALYLDGKTILKSLKRMEAAGRANGAFAEYLVCAMHHKNYYKGTID
jgi:hypothetical protein